jgi:membrane protease YdiL (CAAX protease family)
VFGFAWTDWRRQVWRGLLWTLPWLGVTLLLKYWLVLLHPDVTRLFEPHRAINSAGGMQWGLWCLLLAVYGAMSFAQEYVRTVTQGALHHFYQTVGRPDRWKSLLIANLIFAILHIHLGPVFAVMGFAAGLLWGWIFQREQSYLAAAASHVVLGIWVVFILGVPY